MHQLVIKKTLSDLICGKPCNLVSPVRWYRLSAGIACPLTPSWQRPYRLWVPRSFLSKEWSRISGRNFSSVVEVKNSWIYTSLYISWALYLVAGISLPWPSHDQFPFETSYDEMRGRLSCTYPPYDPLRKSAFHREVGFWTFMRKETCLNPCFDTGHLGFPRFVDFLQTNVAILLYICSWKFLFAPLKFIIFCHPLIVRYIVSATKGVTKHPENKQ